MGKGRVIYGTDVLAEVESREDLSAILSKIKDNFHVPNPALELQLSSENRLIIGLSPTWCWLHYMNETKGYYLPVNPNPDEGTTSFMYGGHYTEAYLKNCIEFDVMLKAASEYLTDGDLPASLTWEEFK